MYGLPEDTTTGGYYTSIYSGEEIDSAVTKVNELTETMTVSEILGKLSELESRVAALEGGGG